MAKKQTWAEIRAQLLAPLNKAAEPARHQGPKNAPSRSKETAGPPAPVPKAFVPSLPTHTYTAPIRHAHVPTAVPRRPPPTPPVLNVPRDQGFGAGDLAHVVAQNAIRGAHAANFLASAPLGFDIESALHGKRRQPEAQARVISGYTTLGVGAVRGSQAAAARIKKQYEHDKARGDYLQARENWEHQHGRLMGIEQQQTLAAGMGVNLLDHGPISTQNLENVGLGAAGVVAGAFAHPIKAVKDIVKMAVSVPVGTGLLVAAMTRPDLSADQRWQMYKAASLGMKKQYADALGGEGTDAFWHSFNDPVNTALLFPIPASAGAQGVRIAMLLRRGAEVADALKAEGVTTTALNQAVRLARDPEKPRMLPYTERAPKGSGVESVTTYHPGDWSSSVLFRNVAQKPYDLASRAIDVIPGARRLPVAMNKRAAAAAGKAQRVEKNRRATEVHAAYREVQSFLNERDRFGRKKNKHFATTLAVLVQKPNGLTDAEMERAVIDNLKAMMADPERMDLPGKDEVTPAEQKIMNRIAAYDKRAEAARSSKRGLTMRRLHNDQRRMGESLANITKQREDLHDEWLKLQDDPHLMPKAFEDEQAYYDGAISALDSQAKVLRDDLSEISVAQPKIDSPRRTQMRQELEKLPYFQDYPQAIEDVLLAGDAAARNWAKIKGRTPEEWWQLRDVRGDVPESDIPLEAYAQTRKAEPAAAGVPDPAALDAKATEIYDRYGHVSGAMPDDVTSAADFAAKSHEVARLAKLGEAHKDWYRESGLAIRDRLGPDNWDEARQIAAAIAYLSRTDSVVPNVGHAMRAYNSYKETGDAGLAGRYPAKGREKLNDIFKNNAWGGYKTNSFFRNILEEYDPARFKKEFGNAADNVKLDLGGEGDEVTVDRWIVRAFGFKDDRVGGKGRYFAAREMIQHIADQLDMTPKQAQAAIWVAVKAETEAGKSAVKVAARNIKNKTKYDAQVAKAVETGKGGPRAEFKPEEPKTSQDFLEASGVHVGSSLNKITHQLRVNAEAAPGSTYAGFPEYGSFSPLAQDEFAREIAKGVYKYNRDLGIPFVPGERGPGLFEPEGAPIETNPAFASNISVGSAMKLDTAKKYGLPRVQDWQRREYDAIVAGQGRGTRQNAMPWLRPMVSENMRDVTAIFVEHPNLTSEDMLALRALRGRGNANWQIAIGHGDGGVWFSQVKGMGMSQARFRAKVGTMIDRHFGSDKEAVGYAHEGGYVENDWAKGDADYEAAIGNSRRPGEIRAASDALAHHYESTRLRFTAHPDGPDGAAAELRADRHGEPDGGPGLEPSPSGAVRHQSRKTDTLGATQLVNSATGERIIWLTEHADFSTVIHELLGHAADEMKDLHPEEFAAVEVAMGRPLEEWTTADHEKFATWFERYLAEGHAPTPELVPVFDRAKQYMRVIYSVLRHAMGPRIPHATRDLFDHYLGGWDSESSTRIATNMGHYDPSDSPFAGARSAAQGELETLQKRNRTRRYNQTQQGMLDQLAKLQKQADKREGTEAEQEALTAQIVRMQAEIVLRADKRVRNLRSKISDMEKALTRDPNNRRFAGALEAAKGMMDDREKILREVFTDEGFDEMFTNRRDLLANYLVQHGLLRPDFEKGTGTYYPMKLDEGFLHGIKLPMTPASNRVLGQTQKALAGVHHRNEMIRWQAGDWSADPAVLQLAHSRATSYQFILEVRELMHQMGRELTQAEQLDPKAHLPSGGYVVNLKGTPLSPDMKAATRGMTNTTDVDHLDDGLFGDNDALEGTLKDFFSNSVVDLDKLPPGFDLGDPNLRFVSKVAVNKIFRPINLNTGGKVWDAASTAARFALIYANVPGYMISNLAGNLVFLTAQQGLNWIPRAVVYGKMLKNDAHFRARVGGQGGMLPAFSAITRGRNFGQRAGKAASGLERNWLAFESKVDEYPRMIAWMAEANKKGYYSKESMIRLLDGKTAKTARDRAYVAERTNQHMIDFTYRVSDRERQTLGRLFFIWPYVRGATAMPFWFAKNYPARTALIAQLSLQQRQYQQAMLGDLAPGREDLFPTKVWGSEDSAQGRQATVLGTRYYNPSGPLADEVRLGSDLVASAFGRKPDNLSARLSSLLNVNVEQLVSVAQGKDPYGNDISLKEQVLNPYGIADSMVPFRRYINAAFDPRYIPRPFRASEGATPVERLEYSLLRIPPHTVSVNWLNAGAQSRGQKTTTQKIDEAVTANMKHFHEVAGAKVHYSRSLRKQVAAKVIYDDRVMEVEREHAAAANFVPKRNDDGTWNFGYQADDYDKAVVAYEVLKKQFPEILAESKLPPPNDFLIQQRLPPRSEQGKLVATVYNDMLNAALTVPPDEKGIKFWAAEYDTQATSQRFTKKLASETKRGVYRASEAHDRALRLRAASGG